MTTFYTKEHEWIKLSDDGTATVGITQHASDALGDIVFVELPEVGLEMNITDPFCVIESVKAASDVYAPLSGEITDVNGDLTDAPETVNSSPDSDGWLIKMKPNNFDSEKADLMDLDAYNAFLETEA